MSEVRLLFCAGLPEHVGFLERVASGEAKVQRSLFEETSSGLATLRVAIEAAFEAGDLLVPCCSSLSPEYQYQCSVISTSARATLSVIGRGTWTGSPEEAYGPVTSDIDTIKFTEPTDRLEVEVTVFSPHVEQVLDKPLLFMLARWTLSRERLNDESDSISETKLEVPAISQMKFQPDIRRRICAPTCMAMVGAYQGIEMDPLELAELSYNQQHDMYGVWPSNIWAASRFGLIGYIGAFSSFSEVTSIIDAGYPVIASISYREGELEGAAMSSTPGHLVVVVGFSEGKVLVNDPAASEDGEVRRAYSLQQFSRIWLQRRGIGYVLFNPLP